ncbi:hypothetical protein HDV05_007782 [Chytridiales sp. JEL 0842]|nr:hypothetical protein HDV05_007782 [Chytridiales sp. JEL 0842]
MTAPFIDPETLAGWLKDPTLKQGTDYAIVDVRDLDFKGGNIKGAINIPSHILLENPSAVLSKLEKPKKVVFHCMLSQVRGPKCANAYLRTLKDEVEAGLRKSGQEVVVLRGGWEGFQERFGAEEELVENGEVEEEVEEED